LIRFTLAMLLSWMVSTVALGASPDKDSIADMFESPTQVIASALHQAIGAPARADIVDQATVRLSEDFIIIPRERAAKLLTVAAKPFSPDIQALLLGSDGVEAPGIIRFVPAGFINSDAALAWTADDMLSSLDDTVALGNPDRAKKNQQPREARGWVLPPHYDPEAHQLSWAALIVPKSAPRETDGETTYHAIGFGREGYIELTVVSSMQKADKIAHMANNFLNGLDFRAGKGYGDVLPADRRASAGLAGAMGIESLHKARVRSNFWGSDKMIPVAGAIVATIGALSLLIYIRRHLRREARRG
jgi:uncharacterized membrane-anchored protein